MMPPVFDFTLRKSNTGDAPPPFTLHFFITTPRNPRRSQNSRIAALLLGSCAPNWLHGKAMTTRRSPNCFFSISNSS